MRRGSIATGVWLVASLTGAVTAGETITWGTEIKPALNEAASSARPVFVDVWAVWCAPCKTMDETTYRDPAVLAAMASFVPLKVDQDVQIVFCDRHEVEVLPVVLFLDADGGEISRLAGLIEPARLLEAMRVVSEGYGAYREALTRPKDADAQLTSGSYLLRAGNAQDAAKHLRRAARALEQAAPAEREPVELELARSQLASGDEKAAAASLERLAAEAVTPAVRGGALEELVRLWRERGDAEQAAAALERLRAEFPDLARGLDEG